MVDDPDGAPREETGDAAIHTALDRLVAGSAKVFAWAIFLAFAISVYEVVARYVFKAPTFWAHETTTFLIAAIFLIGGPIALARDKHIRVRMIYDAVPPGGRRLLDIFNAIVALIFFTGLGYAGAIMTWKATHTPTGDIHLEGTGTAWNPPTPALLKIIILACVVLMFVQTVLHLVRAIRRNGSS